MTAELRYLLKAALLFAFAVLFFFIWRIGDSWLSLAMAFNSLILGACFVYLASLPKGQNDT